MRRVYYVKGKVTKASGLLSWLVTGKPVEGYLIVDGSDDDFKDVVGCTFGVVGELTKAPLIGCIPITSRRFNRTEVTMDSRNYFSKLVFENMAVSIMVDVSDDGGSFNRVEVDGSPSSMKRILMISAVTISGDGKMVSEQS